MSTALTTTTSSSSFIT
ncbi:hypothetical protein COLE_02820 [Cutaneotrichosporon oleaginosum]|nr:hypothetical protein COLE_02820 [Cutaneotrichosporon oleaginosum]